MARELHHSEATAATASTDRTYPFKSTPTLSPQGFERSAFRVASNARLSDPRTGGWGFESGRPHAGCRGKQQHTK